jgi:alkanesulfonate monooxygenase SsuD/methylene tetrahydromethanopterin reductase-like flavin-dependent oxidoreductase (luciferase family)
LPAAGRRPPFARETATLDQVGGGRLTLGVGLGSDRFADELCATAEELDDRRRGQMLDESLEILAAAWSGRPVHHHSRHYTVDGISFLPGPDQLADIVTTITDLRQRKTTPFDIAVVLPPSADPAPYAKAGTT